MMIKYTRIFITLLLAIIVFRAGAQQTTATTSDPYSRYGLGSVSSLALPQNMGMGGLGAAVNNFSGYFNINPVNPASYGALNIATIDMGLYGSSLSLNQTGSASQTNGNFRLDHINFAFPVTKRSALSFGLQPYTEMGYNYKASDKLSVNGTSSTVDTTVNYIYSGNGGLTKAYLGYGFGIGRHLLLGANVSYIFGKLQQFKSTEPNLFGSLNSRFEDSYSIGGINYDYGAQYTIDLSTTRHIILGYSASANSKITSQHSYITSQYNYDDSGNENPALDTLSYTKDAKSKIQLPQTNHFGVTFVSDNKFLIGAEYTMSNWSTLSIDGVNQGLQDSKTYNLGGQITPNANALSNYWATVDYRLGFIYDESYIDVNDANTSTNIKSYALTFGLGLPLRPSSSHEAFYKINFAAEVGKRGTLDYGLVKENYVNFRLSFTLNDSGWFRQYKIH